MRVEVEWEDAYRENKWTHAPLQHEPTIITELGFVVFHDKRGIMLCSSILPAEDSVGGRTFIPGGMIRKIEVFK